MNRIVRALFLISLLPACTQTPDTSGKQFMDVDGVRIHYVQSGAGERTLVMIHGYGAGAFTWKGIQDRTPPGYTTYALDLPGFGYSDKPANFEYGLPAFSSIVARFLEIACPPKTILVGNSMGGAVSIWTAASRPDRIAAIVAIDSAGGGHPPGSLPAIFKVIQMPTIGPLLLRLPSRPLMRNTLEEVYAHDDRITKDLIDLYYQPTRFPGAALAWHRTLADLMGRTERGEVAARMDQVKQPVFLMWGDQDTWTPPSGADVFRSHMPHAISKVYSELGHVPQEEDPARVVPDLFTFTDGIFSSHP
ncbi:MAG: alpha/beta fold hydrolase [Nitrospirae bacterium]|nr:alpha/beta fold hydrolase [Nitrospirota bacterium]